MPTDLMSLITPDQKFKRGAITALKRLKRKKTFNESVAVRFSAFTELIDNLTEIYEVKPITVAMVNIDGSNSGTSCYYRNERMIVMKGKLSIITLLHEFAHSLYGSDEVKCQKWSLNLFNRVYPRQFEKLVQNNSCMVAAD